jgi:hypothetical protein
MIYDGEGDGRVDLQFLRQRRAALREEQMVSGSLDFV